MTNFHTNIKPSVYIFVGISFLIVLILISTMFIDSKNPSRPKKNTKSAKGKNIDKATLPVKIGKFYVNGAENTREVMQKSQDYYQAIPQITSLPPGEVLNLETIRINIFKNRNDYVKETGKPSWSEGFADYKNKEIFIVEGEGLAISILPHELSHLFFDSYMGFENADVNWIDEGAATLVQVSYDSEQAISFRNAMASIRNSKQLNIEQLANYKLDEKTPVENINIYYAQTLSLVDYLIKTDSLKWKAFLESLKSGKSFNDSLVKTYELTPGELEQKWLDFIKINKQTWEK